MAEVIMMENTTVKEIVNTLRSLFSRLRGLEQIVSDNGPQFNPTAVPWRSFDHNQRVLVRNYSSGTKLVRSMVIERAGPSP